jgi:CRP/FNR family transcriptional regulator, dissimilatory nitrate respiration regulator
MRVFSAVALTAVKRPAERDEGGLTMARPLCQPTLNEQGRLILRGLGETDTTLLARLPMFSGLRTTQVTQLLESTEVHRTPRRTVLFHQGEPATRFYVILEGCVMLHRVNAHGHESVISLMNRGDSFAEAAMFDCADFPVTATVITDARLLMVPARPFVRQLRDDPRLALNILASMSRQLRRLVEQIEQRTAASSTERLAGFLLRLCPDDAPSTTFELPLDKQLIAGALGMQPETFSRSLSRLRRLGVTCSGIRVTIADIDALGKFCAGSLPLGRPASR